MSQISKNRVVCMHFILLLFPRNLFGASVIDVTKKCFSDKDLSEDVPQCEVEVDIIYRQRCVRNAGMYLILDDESQKNIVVTCHATYPMDVEMLVENGYFLSYDQNERFDVIHERRRSKDINSSWVHSVRLPILTENSIEQRQFKVLRRYAIHNALFEADSTEAKINRRQTQFMIFHAGPTLFRLGPEKVRVHSDTVDIPCLYDYSNGIRVHTLSTYNGTKNEEKPYHKLFCKALLSRFSKFEGMKDKALLFCKGHEYKLKTRLDSYNPFHGFKFNISETPMLYGNYEYDCYGEGPAENPSIIGPAASMRPFGVEYLRGLLIEPKTLLVECYHFPCEMNCEYDEPVTLYISEEKQSRKTVQGRLLFRTFENVTRYQARYIRDGSNSFSHEAVVSCVREADGEILHVWKVLTADIFNPVADQDQTFHMKISYDELSSEGSLTLKCLSGSKDIQISTLFSLTCNNWIECKFYMDCVLRVQDVQRWKNYFLNDPGNCSPPIIQSQVCKGNTETSCREVKLKERMGGVIRCEAQNNSTYQSNYFIGFDNVIYLQQNENMTGVPSHAVVKISLNQSDTKVFSTGFYWFSCESHHFVAEHGLTWSFRWKNGTTTLPFVSKEIYPEDETDWSSNVNPKRKSKILLDHHDIAALICSAPLARSNDWVNQELKLDIKESTKPSLKLPKLVYLEAKTKGSVECTAESEPTSEVNWLISQNSFQGLAPEHNPIVHVDGKTATLTFPFFTESLSGDYMCWASNGLYNVTQTVTIGVKAKSWTGAIVGASLTTFFLFLVIMLIFYRRWRTANVRECVYLQTMLQKISDDELDEFLNGIADHVNTDDYKFVFPALAVPYDNSYEIDPVNLKIDKESHLGSGQFGIVYKAALKSPEAEETNEMVAAVKTLKSIGNTQELKNILNEIKLMIYLGKHENLVQLFGASTKNCQRGEIYMVLEYCELGSLQKYFEQNRNSFLKAFKCESENDYQPFPSKLDQGAEYVNETRISLFSKLVRWSYEIACGMEYIANKRMIHGDLAARNVLLQKKGQHEIIKISDFGLSRKLYEYTQYVKTKQEPLPWRWMSIEAIRQFNFSTKSDVWAFGITLWEMFTLGDVPYPGFNYDNEFLSMLESGYRNAKPTYAPDDLYDLMRKCWQKAPEERPDFGNIKQILEEKLGEYN